MPTHRAASGPAPKRLQGRATWLASRMHARASGLLSAGFDAEGGGLRSYHYRLLSALEEWGATSQAELGRNTGIDRSDVTVALAELESRGLVSRSIDPANKRRKIVTITEQGGACLLHLDTVIDGIQSEFLSPLSRVQQRQLLQLMSLLVDKP